MTMSVLNTKSDEKKSPIFYLRIKGKDDGVDDVKPKTSGFSVLELGKLRVRCQK